MQHAFLSNYLFQDIPEGKTFLLNILKYLFLFIILCVYMLF